MPRGRLESPLHQPFDSQSNPQEIVTKTSEKRQCREMLSMMLVGMLGHLARKTPATKSK
jgi:hypothetical protein